MGSEEFSTAVRGSTGDPVSVSNQGSLDTNDYPNGNARDEDGSAFSYTENPSETIKEFGFTIIGAEIDVEVTTVGGDTFTFPLDAVATFDRWDVDKLVLKDPNNNTPRVAFWWAGE